ncbi:pre-mRNA processing factor 3 isoform X2 [Lycorma delicatula]|uniref:pre-mRNA processing factor 3 isoform X2 n=1 Tax=Lycorma delicatula TaxID=130591 RepID=UPI003F51842E
MTASLSRKEVDEIKPYIDKTIEKFLGFTEPSLVLTAMNCLMSGYDRKKTTEKLSSLLDSSKASRLAEKVFEIVEDVRTGLQARKRHHDSDIEITKKAKISNSNNTAGNVNSGVTISSGPLSANQIKDMMANAQKMIEERKKALNALKTNDAVPTTKTETSANKSNKNLLPPSASVQRTEEKAKKIAQLQAQIQSKLSSGVLGSVTSRSSAPGVITAAPTDKPTPLILDSQGRTVDITGKEIQLTHVVPTLKANIRAKKREEFRQQLQERTVEDISDSHFFDPRIGAKPSIRNKRALRFHEPGKFQQLADRMRMKAQLEKLQSEISQIARKTGITSATKLALIAPKVETQVDEIPEVEWWDSVILENDEYFNADGNLCIKESAITHLVEHPIQAKSPADSMKPTYMPVFLTKKERKKLRRQNRREAWKEEQEKIRLGLEPPPEPKLRISNLMRVLGTEAVQDPTKIEAHVRAQMAKRKKAHEEANASRKLTDEQRREKKMRKLQEDTTLGVHVAVYRVRELTSASKKFKVETNAKQLFMTGGVVMFKDCNVIVVEGGIKQQKKFKRLMIHRIKWEEDTIKAASGKEEPNKCDLVWEIFVWE